MQEIGSALLEYRETMGDGIRFPVVLEELSLAGLLPQGYDFSGPLTGNPMIYDSEVPVDEDPSLWVVCSDVQLRRSYNMFGRRSSEIVLAAVILGDGTALVLTNQELQGYGGAHHAVGNIR